MVADAEQALGRLLQMRLGSAQILRVVGSIWVEAQPLMLGHLSLDLMLGSIQDILPSVLAWLP